MSQVVRNRAVYLLQRQDRKGLRDGLSRLAVQERVRDGVQGHSGAVR